MGKVTLLTGGSRSGKSAHALRLATKQEKRVFIATAEAFDQEMTTRISKHQQERSGDYITIEEPIRVADAINTSGQSADLIVLDCLTVWMGNLGFHLSESDKKQEIEALLKVLENPPCEVLVVTNELGMGIIPENKLSRQFRDDAGFLNQQVAAIADRVILMVSGIPIVIKE